MWSIMPEPEIVTIPAHLYPHNPTLFSYERIFAAVFGYSVRMSVIMGMSGYGQDIRNGWINSILISIPTSLVATAVSTFAGYAFGTIKFRFKNTLLFALLTSRLLPAVVIMIPYFMILQMAGLIGSLEGLFISYLCVLTPLLTWLLMGFFATLPMETERAARVDGCSRLRALRSVVFPMAAPGIATVGIIAFLVCWNEFLFAWIVTGGSPAETLPPAIVGIFYFGAEFSLMSAAVVLTLIPTIVLAVVFSKYITKLHIVDPLAFRIQ